MAKAKKSASKKSVAKKTVTKKTSKGEFTAKQIEAQEKIAEVNFQARKLIYDAGKKGAPLPTWKKANKEAAKKVYGK